MEEFSQYADLIENETMIGFEGEYVGRFVWIKHGGILSEGSISSDWFDFGIKLLHHNITDSSPDIDPDESYNWWLPSHLRTSSTTSESEDSSSTTVTTTTSTNEETSSGSNSTPTDVELSISVITFSGTIVVGLLTIFLRNARDRKNV